LNSFHCQQQLVTRVHVGNTAGSTIRLMSRDRPVYHADLGRFATEMREARGWNQKMAADLAERRGLKGLSRQVLLRLERGQIKNPEPDVLRAVAELYEVPYSDVVLRLVAARFGLVDGRDLTRHAGDQQSGASLGGGVQHETAAARVRELEERVRRYEETAREVHQVADYT